MSATLRHFATVSGGTCTAPVVVEGPQGIHMFVNSGSDYSIVDSTGRFYTPDQARAAWASGRVTDYNVAFYRLACLGFDFEALKAHYASGKR